MLITEMLRQILFLSHEWGPTVRSGSFDIKTAFEFMDHRIIFNALVSRDVPEHLAAAVLMELMDLQVEVVILG